MTLMKNEFLSTGSETVLAEDALRFDYHTTYALWDPSDEAEPQPVVDDGIIRDVSPEQARKDATLEIIQARRANADTPERKRLLAYFERIVREDAALPRSGSKYHLRNTLARAGTSFAAWMEQTGMREDFERIAGLLPLEDDESGCRIPDSQATSFIGRARSVMDEMEANGETLPRVSANSPHPSIKAFARRMGLPFSAVVFMSSVRVELGARIAEGRIILGDPVTDPDAPNRAERRAARKKLKRVISVYKKTGKPIPASSENARRIDIDWLLDEAGIFDFPMRECMKCDPDFRKDLAEVIRTVSLKPVHLSRIDPRVVSYGRLEEEGEQTLREMYRRENPNSEPMSKAEDAWVANQWSFLRRFRRQAERTTACDAAADFTDAGFQTVIDRAKTGSVKGDAAFERGIGRFRAICAGLTRATTLPASFAGALDAAMVATGRNAPSLAKVIGCRKGLIHAWRRGQAIPGWQNSYLVDLLEKELGLAKDTLMARLPSIRSGRTITRGRKEVTLEDGSKLNLAPLWRYMHMDAPLWPHDRLRDHAVEVHDRVYGSDTAHRIRLRAAQSNAYNLPEPDAGSPIWKELDDLIAFQTGLIDDGRLRNPVSEWKSPATINHHREQVTIFARWLMLAVDEGGLGVSPERVSFGLLVNYRITLRYVAWRILRAADLQLNGQPIGPKITSTEKAVLSFVANLLDPVYGWITQSRGIFPQLVEDARRFRMPFIREGKGGTEVVDDDTCPMLEVMPGELVEAVASADGWRGQCALSHAHIKSTGSRVARSFKLMRNPQDLVMPILKHQKPLAVALRMVRDALAHARPIATAPLYHAQDVHRALAFLLLMLVVFRSGTIRELTWRADGTGHVRKTADGWEIVVGAEHFKNGFNPEFFGPSWNRRDYERSLGNWGSFDEIMEHYITKCRPILLGGRESDLLFVPYKGRDSWNKNTFSNLILSFTRRWCVYSARFETGMPGVRSFGPHPARNIVATHIIRNHPTEDRWRLASLVLQTSEANVRLRYGWLTVREELAKVDPLFDEASALAASEQPLY